MKLIYKRITALVIFVTMICTVIPVSAFEDSDLTINLNSSVSKENVIADLENLPQVNAENNIVPLTGNIALLDSISPDTSEETSVK
ncbi:MAG: hypothetical protein J6N52_02285, partial [Clostridia bacterium]|nr:hypothetical protein [Clostridia bacterium]